MGKAKRKINRLRRKMLKKGVKPRIPVAGPSFAFKSKKKYDRKKSKIKLKKMVKNDF